MDWNETYLSDKRVWGDSPGELAVFAGRQLQDIKSQPEKPEILDVGCGYGRDALYLARGIGCRVLGIDSAAEAIEMARNALAGSPVSGVEFQCLDFKKGVDRKFGIVFASNLYQLLDRENRGAFRDFVKNSLERGGTLFLGTLSVSDPEHFGKGSPVLDDDNSFTDEKFLHLCSEEELRRDFGFLEIGRLAEHRYDEPRSDGRTHHHVSWFLMGRYS
jgi:SAM-dependent methyltransferase